jgi:hypothetical protein
MSRSESEYVQLKNFVTLAPNIQFKGEVRFNYFPRKGGGESLTVSTPGDFVSKNFESRQAALDACATDSLALR